MKKIFLSNSGVSLIELIIAIAIISIIGTFVGASLYTGVVSENKNSVTRQNAETVVGNLDISFDSSTTGDDLTVTVNFPASTSESLDCTKVMDSSYGLDLGIVKVK